MKSHEASYTVFKNLYTLHANKVLGLQSLWFKKNEVGEASSSWLLAACTGAEMPLEDQSLADQTVILADQTVILVDQKVILVGITRSNPI